VVLLNRVCVFCGSSFGRDPAYVSAARAVGRVLAARGIDLVYGGGSVGLMGEIADTVLAGGGSVTGVIPEALIAAEIAHPGVTDLRVVATMHERKALMAELSDAFVALPGGFGTLEEIAEAITWSQLGLHQKPCALLDVGGFFGPLIAHFDRAVEDGFISPANRALVVIESDPGVLLDRLEWWTPPSRPNR
jgi:uncharacterized protein (TIGR00730 family)